MRFSVYSGINGNSIEIFRNQALRSIFSKAIAKHWHFSLTEVTLISKNDSLLLVNVRTSCVRFHFGKNKLLIFLALTTPSRTINKTSI